MVTDSDKGNTGRTRSDEAEESVGVVDSGGVENRRHCFGKSTDCHDYSPPGDPAEVGPSSCPLHRPLPHPLEQLENELQRILLYRTELLESESTLCSSLQLQGR